MKEERNLAFDIGFGNWPFFELFAMVGIYSIQQFWWGKLGFSSVLRR